MAGKIYVAKTSAVLDTEDGGRVAITGGVTRVREGHPLLRGRESMFEEIGVHYEVETARQAPEPEAKPEPRTKPEPVAAPATADDEAYVKPGPKPAAAKPQRGPRRASGN